jgi:hypothetical protein
MSSSLPPEILDLIVDHLHDEPTALKACCVVSKSWIQRSRIHLFASVEFCPPAPPIELWKKAFLDLPNSPAHHARSLSIPDLSLVTASGVGAGGWIRTFHNVVHLHLEGLWTDRRVSFVPFHGFSPTLRSLSLRGISSEVSDLICSFPLLEDLALVSFSLSDTWNTPSTSPKLTGSLSLRSIRGIHSAARRLLDLPNGLHFVKLTVMCHAGDVKPTTDLVSRCSDTLESLEVSYYAPGAFSSGSTSGQHLTTSRRSRPTYDTS